MRPSKLERGALGRQRLCVGQPTDIEELHPDLGSRAQTVSAAGCYSFDVSLETADSTYQPASLSLGQSDDTVDVDPIYAVSGTVWYDEYGNGIEPNPLFSYLHVERLPVSLYTARAS